MVVLFLVQKSLVLSLMQANRGVRDVSESYLILSHLISGLGGEHFSNIQKIYSRGILVR